MSLQLLGRVTGFTVELTSLLSCSLPTLTLTHTYALIQDVLCFFTKNVKEQYSSKEDTMLHHNADGSHLREECVVGDLIRYHCL